jgi:hypothetical protein
MQDEADAQLKWVRENMSDKALLAEFRIAEIDKIDKWFAEATGWGSWMVDAANEREGLVNALRQEGYRIEHKHQARSSTGGRVD